MSGVRIEVDPHALIAAGQQLGSLGSQLGLLSDALGSALSSGIASGMDPAGLNFGIKYGRQTSEFANAMADAANAFKNIGYMLEATGYNYKNADAASTIGGGGPVDGLGGQPSTTTASALPGGPNSATVPPPTKWRLIQPFLTLMPGGVFAGAVMTWPSGNSAMMRLTAAQWRNFERGLAVFEPQLSRLKTVVAAQQTPETGAILTALDNLAQGISALSSVSGEVARSVEEFAGVVQESQDAIRRMLDRLSVDGLWDTVKGIFTGDGDRILREVAADVGSVLNNFQQQVKGVVGLLDELTILIGDAATAFQRWIRPVVVGLYGEQVGGAIADAVTLYTDFQVGLATGLINTVSGLVALADADTWKGMAELAVSVAQDPSTLPGVLENMGKEFVAWDKWSSENPGRAAGEAVFNIGSLFVPGGAFSKSGAVAKGLSKANDLFKADRGPFGNLSAIGPGTRALDDVGDPSSFGTRVPEIPATVTPGAVPPLTGGPKPDTPSSGSSPGRSAEPSPGSSTEKPVSRGAEGARGERAPISDDGRTPSGHRNIDAQHHPPFNAGAESDVPQTTRDAPDNNGDNRSRKDGAGTHGDIPDTSRATDLISSDPGEAATRGGAESPVTGETLRDGDIGFERPTPTEGGSQATTPTSSPDVGVSAEHSTSRLLLQELEDMRPWDQERLDRALTPGKLESDLLDGGCPPEIAASAAHSPYSGMTTVELLERYWNPDEHTWKWPPHNGFKDGHYQVMDHIPDDVRIDRIGVVSDHVGDFMGAHGDSYPARGLAPGTSGDYNVFRGTGEPLPPGW